MKKGGSLRVATAADAAALGRVHVACLHETYAGLMPPEWLAERTEEERIARWRSVLEEPAGGDTIAIRIAEFENALAGFASCGRQRAKILDQSGFAGEISAIYVLRQFQRQQLGVLLMRSLASALLEYGITAAALWCLRGNVGARRFYEHMGGEFLLEQTGSEAHAGQIEVAYGWRDLELLARQG